MDFLVVLIELFLFRAGLVSAKFSRRRGRPPPIIFARIDRPMNADSVYTKKLRSRLFSSKVRFYTENGRVAFFSPLGT